MHSLSERHEALSQTVELLLAEHRENEKFMRERHEAAMERHQALAQTIEVIAGMHKDNENLMGEMMLAMAQPNTAHAHNDQFSDHEERIEQTGTK